MTPMSNDANMVAKICTINICGLSQRSNMMLSKFAYDNSIYVFGIQETGSGKDWKKLDTSYFRGS